MNQEDNPLKGKIGLLGALAKSNATKSTEEAANSSPPKISGLGALFGNMRRQSQDDRNPVSLEKLNRFQFQCQLPIKETQVPIKPPPNPNLPTSPKSMRSGDGIQAQPQPIQFMGLNYMSKQIMYQTNSSLCLFSIPKSRVTTVRTFADILNEPLGKSELYTIENIQPLIMKNCWVTVKNKKQLLFFNSHMDKGIDPAADSNGIIDVKVNQKSEEILTITKDFKQVRIWVYDIQDRVPKKFNSDRHMRKFQTFEVTISNRKNIYFNLGLFQLNIISEMDIMVLQSSSVNEISVWNSNDGVIIYNFSLDDYSKIDNGKEEFSGSSFTKDFANKAGATALKNQSSQQQNGSENRKFNYNVVATYQEFIIVYSNNTKKLIIWDLVRCEVLMVRHLKNIKGPIVQLFAECAVDIYSGGLLLLNDQGLIYEYSIAQGKMQSMGYNLNERAQIPLSIDECEGPTSPPMIKNVVSQFFLHQQRGKMKELEQLYPHSVQDDDYHMLQDAYKLYFLQIENGCRQLYILRDQSIDIIELFQPAYPIYEIKAGKYDEKILKVYREDIQMTQDDHKDFLRFHNNFGEIIFQRIDKLRSEDESKGGGFQLVSSDSSYLKISATEILQKCIDAAGIQSPSNKRGTDSDDESPSQKRSSKFKSANYENFLTAKILHADIDLDIGILVFYNIEGMIAVVNLFTMVRRFLQFGIQGYLQKIEIIEKDNHDNNYYLVKKASHQNFTLSDYKKLLQIKKPYFDDYSFSADPNFSVVLVCENDLIEIRHDSKSNSTTFKNKIPFNEKIVNIFYIKQKLQMLAVCRDGSVRDIETESFTIKRYIRTQWEDVSSSFISQSGDQTMLLGHDRGIITSESIDLDYKKTNSLERKFQIHNFHREQIISLNQPKNNNRQFISLCKEKIVCIWFLDNERPLKAIYFNNEFTSIMAFSDQILQAGIFNQNIDKILMIGNLRVYETEVRSAPYYRSYNEDIQYEWECFSYEISKQIANIKKSLQEGKEFESHKRFQPNRMNLDLILSLKMEVLRKNQTLEIMDQSQETSPQKDVQIIKSLTNNFQLRRPQFLASLNCFLANNTFDTLPQRLLDLEYHYFTKKNTTSNISDYERDFLLTQLNLDFQYLKVLKQLTREQILQSAKQPNDKDRGLLQIQRLKDQNKRINTEIFNQNNTYLKETQTKDMLLKTQELKNLNQKRKNNPSVMMGLISFPEDIKRKNFETFRIQPNPLDMIPNLKIDARKVELESQNRQAIHKVDQLGSQTERQVIKGNMMKSQSQQNIQKVGFHIKLPQITVNDYSKELVTIRDQLKSREDFLKKDSTYYIFKNGVLTSRKNSPEQAKLIQSSITTKHDEPLMITSGANLIRQPPLAQKRSEHFMTTKQNFGGQMDSGKKGEDIDKQSKSPERIKRIDNSSPVNFPKRKIQAQPIVQEIIERITTDEGTSKMTETVKFQDSESKISNAMIQGQNLQTIDNSKSLVIDAQNILNGKQSQPGKRRVFSNQRIQSECLKPIISDSLRDIQSIRIPKLQQTIGSDVNTSQVKNEQNPISDQHSMLDISGHFGTVNSTVSIRVEANPTQIVDVKQFWHIYQQKLNLIKEGQMPKITKTHRVKSQSLIQNYNSQPIQQKDLMIQSHQTKLFDHKKQKQRGQVQIQSIHTNTHKPNESLEYVSTEPNSKIINEQSVEEEKDEQDLIRSQNQRQQQILIQNQQSNQNSIQLSQIAGTKLVEKQLIPGKNQTQIDNISYIENFFKFKVDPEDLLYFFDEHNIDIENQSKDQLKQILLDYLQQRQHERAQNKLEEKYRQVQQMREYNKQQKLLKEEIAKLKVQQQKEQNHAKDIEVFEEIFKKYTIEQQRFNDSKDDKTAQQQKNQKQSEKLKQPKISHQQLKEEQDQINRKKLEQFIKENIFQKWIFRKVNQCIELLDKGMDRQDALSKICPEAVFQEVHKNQYQWKNNKIKKQKKNQKYQMKEEQNGQNNNQSSNQYGIDQENRPDSQYQSNNDIGAVLKIGPQNQLRNKMKSPNTLAKEGINFSQEDGTSTLNQRQDSKANSQDGDKQSEMGGGINLSNKNKKHKNRSRGSKFRKNDKTAVNDDDSSGINGQSRSQSVATSLRGSQQQQRNLIKDGSNSQGQSLTRFQNENTKNIIQKLLPGQNNISPSLTQNQLQATLNLQKTQSESLSKLEQSNGIDLSQIPSLSQTNSQQFQSFATEKSILGGGQQQSLGDNKYQEKIDKGGIIASSSKQVKSGSIDQRNTKPNSKDLTVKIDKRFNQNNLKSTERDVIMEHDIEQSIEDKSDEDNPLGSRDQSEMKSMALFRINDDHIRAEDQSPSKISDRSNKRRGIQQIRLGKNNNGTNQIGDSDKDLSNNPDKQSFESMNSNMIQLNGGESFKNPFQNERILVNYGKDENPKLTPMQNENQRVNLTEEDDERISNYSNKSITRKDIKSRDAIMMNNKYKEKQAQSSRNQDIKPANLKDRLSRSLNKKINEKLSEQSKNNNNNQYPNQSSKESNRTEIESSIKAGGAGQIMKLFAQGVKKNARKDKAGDSIQGSDSKARKSALSSVKEGGEKTPKSALTRVSTFKQNKLAAAAGVATISSTKSQKLQDNDPLKRQNSIEERVSEDSRDDIRIDITENEVDTIKDNCFSLISEKLFDLSPRDRIENIKIAATLEQLDFQKACDLGLQYNERRDNYGEMVDKIKIYLRGHEKQNAGIRINQKTFNDLKKRLMPDPNISPIDFINVLKTGVPSTRGSKSSRNSFQDQVDSYMRKSIKEISDPKEEEKMEENQIQELNRIKCDEVLSNIFNSDQEFKYFKGRLKEYRMKFGQQTQFVESVNDVEDQDRRDYATFDRLEAYRKNNDRIKEVTVKVKKFENTKGLVRDVPALAGEGKNNNGVQDMGSYMITIEGQGDKPDEKFSLNQLADEVLHTFLEVKKKNKRLDHNHAEKKLNHDKKLVQDERSSNPVTSNQSIQENSLNTTKILKKYRLNLEEKYRLQNLTEFERQERKYGLMAKNDPDYLNPVLSQKYYERQYFNSTVDKLHLPKINIANTSTFKKNPSKQNI